MNKRKVPSKPVSKRPRLAPSRRPPSDDESVTSDDDLLNPPQPDNDSADDFFEETADEKRIRLAKAYLAEVGERIDSDDDESDSGASNASAPDKMDSALRQDLLLQQNKLKHSIAASLTVQSSSFHRCHSAAVTSVQINPWDERSFATTGKDGRLSVFREAAAGYKKVLELAVDDKALYALCWTSVSTVAVAGESKTIFLVHLQDSLNADGKMLVNKLRSHQGKVTGLLYAPPSSKDEAGELGRLVSVGADKAVKQWLLLSSGDKGGSYMESYFGHTGEVLGLSVLADGSPVTCGYDGSCRVWNLEKDSHKVLAIGATGATSVEGVAGVDGKHFIAGTSGGEVVLFGTSYRKAMDTFKVRKAEMGKSGDGDWVTSVGAIKNSDVAMAGGKGWVNLLKVAAASGETGVTGKKKKMEINHLSQTTIQVPGIVNDISFGASGKIAVLAIGRDHRLGRWLVDKKGKNGVVVVRMTHACSTLD
jgi:ribosomal RNA-processing protein 9